MSDKETVCTCGDDAETIPQAALYNPMPLIGDDAPAFKAETTMGPVKFPEDYKGKWVILFSHPADFTPVCTSEIAMFSTYADEFKKLDTELLGVSVDSVSSHLAWLKEIEDNIEFKGHKDFKITFPIIADGDCQKVRHDSAALQQYQNRSLGFLYRSGGKNPSIYHVSDV